MATYEQTEVLYPDQDVTVGTSLPASNACDLPPYTVYNLNKNIKTCPDVSSDFFVYEPANSNNQQQQAPAKLCVEEVLKQNQEVWCAYKSGRFNLKSYLDNGPCESKKIVLKEKPDPCNRCPNYTVRKYRVQVSQQKNKDDHLLLVSFQSNKNTCSSGSSSGSSNNNSNPLAGPGIDLIAQIVDGSEQQQQQQQQHHQPQQQYHVAPFQQQQQQQQQQQSSCFQSRRPNEDQDSFDEAVINEYAPECCGEPEPPQPPPCHREPTPAPAPCPCQQQASPPPPPPKAPTPCPCQQQAPPPPPKAPTPCPCQHNNSHSSSNHHHHNHNSSSSNNNPNLYASVQKALSQFNLDRHQQ